MDNQVHVNSILVVDTDAEALFTLSQELVEAGFRVHTAINVEQAIAIGIREHIDLLISRFRLDVGTANVLAMRLRTIKRLSNMAVLNICGHQLAGVVLRTCGRFPEYSVRRPVNVNVLVKLANLTLANRGIQRPTRDIEFGNSEPKLLPLIPPPHGVFTQSSLATANSFKQ